MSFKTDRLAALFPDVYAALDTGSLLYAVLDTIGAELLHADAELKALLKSHWVDYAPGYALDPLAAGFGLERRTMRDGTTEADEAFRARLRAVVPLFTGGGTVDAVKGAVRSAIGLPFDLEKLKKSVDPDLVDDLGNLVQLEEFSPEIYRANDVARQVVNGALEVVLDVSLPSVGTSTPRITLTFTGSAARSVSVECVETSTGVRSLEELLLQADSTLVLSANDATKKLNAILDGVDVTQHFVGLKGEHDPLLPDVPSADSHWKFRAHGAAFDVGAFDAGEPYDAPAGFAVELSRVRRKPLTFDVRVPYFVDSAVEALKQSRGYTGDLPLYASLPLDKVQAVIDQTKAAGVEGHIQFSLGFAENHDLYEAPLRVAGARRDAERHDASEAFVLANVKEAMERQDQDEHFALGGVFDVSVFDQSFGFQ